MAKAATLDIPKIAPRGLRRTDAAAYIGVSPTKFDEWVTQRVMPSPKRRDGIVVWDRIELDTAFDALSDENPELTKWDDRRV